MRRPFSPPSTFGPSAKEVHSKTQIPAEAQEPDSSSLRLAPAPANTEPRVPARNRCWSGERRQRARHGFLVNPVFLPRDTPPVLICPFCRRPEPLLLLVSGTLRNPGRMFLKCGAATGHCKPYFRWLDEYVDEMTDVLTEGEVRIDAKLENGTKNGDLFELKKLNRKLAKSLEQQKTVNSVAFACLFVTCAVFVWKK